MTIKQIVTKNIQNHKNVVLDFPEYGLIVLSGDNNNGKSVVIKALTAIIYDLLRKPQKRDNLINEESTFGEVHITRYDDWKLSLHLTREAAQTYFTLYIPGQEPIVRYLSDKSYNELVERFGFHVVPGHNVSLQIGEADDALLFYKTPNKLNGDLVVSSMIDGNTKIACENMENLLVETRKARDEYRGQIRAINSALGQLTIYDTEVLRKKRNYLAYILSVLSTVYIPQGLPVLQPVPKITYCDVYVPELPLIHYPKIYDIQAAQLPDVSELAKDIAALKDRRCPTCGRRFLSDDTCESDGCGGHAQEV